MDGIAISNLIVPAFLIVEGLYMLATGKMIGGSGMALKYTEESLHLSNRVCGVAFIIGSIFWFVAEFAFAGQKSNIRYVCYIIASVLVIIGAIAGVVIRKKKTNESTGPQNKNGRGYGE